MKFFKYAFKQSEKGIGKVFLFSLLLAFITVISVVVAIAKEVSYMNSEEFYKEFESEFNCGIDNYQLSCKEDLYDFGTAKIDLNYDSNDLEMGYELILTKTSLITSEGERSYESILTYFDIMESDYTIDDAIDFINSAMPLVYTLVIIFSLIGLFIFYPLGNLLLALIVRGIINSVFKTRFDFKSIYKITIVTTLPYVLFNAITRMIFGQTLSNQVPIMILAVVIDYAIIYGLTHLAVKEGLKDKPVDQVIEGSVVEESPRENQ
ncbi:MAG: hypothetical protein K0Q49_153 [Haloplasmataceae bacterium]|nr:hypothetical protein [Haloplasmataceae bacterium]